MNPLRRSLLLGILALAIPASAADGNRLTYLDESDPFYPHRNFPKLITPQWVGEPGVEAVVILAIDDMRETPKYETFLRPILQRLKQIDGRAPVSIMVNAIAPTNAQLQGWLKEGVSLEVHTLAHPCPCLMKGDFDAAANTYHGCVELMNLIPGNKPVAFRMPCCDSMNSPSPRFYSEIFNRANAAGQFLTIDSSVMCILTTNDTTLPRDLVLDADGREKFRKYLPTETNATTRVTMKSFTTTIEDYPYPYVIGKLCWEFPAMIPSDWEAFNLHGSTNPVTLADWKSALDAVVLKQGVFSFIFHPHGWSSPAQFVEFIDYAVQKHGKKVKFLTFKAAQERLDKNLLAGQPLRHNVGTNEFGQDNGVRLLDLNNDGFLDLVVGNEFIRQTRLWDSTARRWKDGEFPKPLIERHEANQRLENGLKFGILTRTGNASMLKNGTGVPVLTGGNAPGAPAHVSFPREASAWHFNGAGWDEDAVMVSGTALEMDKVITKGYGGDSGVRLRDLDHDGLCEVIVANPQQTAVYAWSAIERNWKRLPYALPVGALIADALIAPARFRPFAQIYTDAGLRFLDVNGDGYDDVFVSNEERYSLHLFIPKANPRLMWEVGWNDEVWSGTRGGSTGHRPVPPGDPPGGTGEGNVPKGDPNNASVVPSVPAGGSPTGTGGSPVPPSSSGSLSSDMNIPPIVRGGTNRNNGVWFKNNTMWIQNEDTAHLPDKVDRRTFRELLTADQPPPLAPEQALASMRPRPGFKVELVAAEPLVQDPIAFEWGADGRLWVVELTDYPLGRVDPAATDRPTRAPHGEEILTPPEGGRYVPGGRIKLLEDTNGDGIYDKATIFLDGLNFPTGVMPWRNGIIVSAAPEIFYAEDTDGDGKADKRKALFTGFVEGNQQHRVNGFDYGLDNWVYAANGESGGTIRSAVQPASMMVSLRGHDCRFRPDTGEVEAVAGTTQYGRHRDDWGNWFGNNNPVWLWHYFLPEQYLARNLHLAVKSTKQMLANYPDSTRLYPASRTRQRFNDHHQFGHVTSGNSAMPYRDELFGPEFATSVFISDPVHNLVHREVLEPDGVTFTSHRAADETNREFLASTDLWFRPTMLKTGPDGALYIADMYRLVIEHPEWIPKWMQQRLDLRAGSDKGRIYRVFPEGAPPRKVLNMAKLDTAGLVAAMDSPNGWQRDTAQRLLVHAGDKSAVEGLKRLVVEAKNPKTRLQAICTLEGLGALTPEILTRVWLDSHPAVREQAVRLSEPFGWEMWMWMVTTSDSRVFLRMMNDEPDIRVRYQLAFTLGSPNWSNAVADQVLTRLALKDFEMPAMQTAIMCSAPRYVEQMLAQVVEPENATKASSALIEQLLELAAVLNNHQAIAHALAKVAGANGAANAAWKFNILAGLVEGQEQRNRTLRQFAAECGPEVGAAAKELEKLFPTARTVAMDTLAEEPERVAAIRLLARGPEERDADLQRLGQLLGAQHPTGVQRAALSALARQKVRLAADALLGGWKTQGPALRTETLNVLLTRPDWCRALLAAVQSGQIPAGQIGAAFQQKLLNHSDITVKQRAADLFTATSKDRQALIKQYAGVAKLAGDAGKGMALFRQQCATCHRLRGEGSDVGPDLGALGAKDVPTLLVAILDPNQAVEARYVNYTAATKGEREVSGILTAETANSITLRAPGGREETLLRSDLRELTSSGLSLMPEGLEKALTPQDMADLLAALAGR